LEKSINNNIVINDDKSLDIIINNTKDNENHDNNVELDFKKKYKDL
jgi:hypothetical protein